MSDRLKKIISALLILIILGCSYIVVDEYINSNKQENEVKIIKEIISKKIDLNSEERFNKEIWSELKSQNNDFIGYIVIDDIIEQPVVKTNNNDYYLHHTFNKEYVQNNGAPFLDYRSTLSDDNIVIYGHNNSFNQDKIFSRLNDIILRQDYYEEHSIIELYLENEVRTYNICYAYYLTEEDYQHYSFDQSTFFDYMDFETFIQFPKENSMIKSIHGDISFGDNILTIQTCKRYNQDIKVIIVAKEEGKRYY